MVAQEGWPGKGGDGERDKKQLWQQPRQRHGVGGSSGATTASFKPATGDDAATRSSLAELDGARSAAARRGLEGGKTRVVGGEPGQAVGGRD